MNAFDQMREALDSAEHLERAIGHNANRIATFLTRHNCANLRRVNCHELRDLKRALRGFDMTTGEWKR